MPNSQQLLDFGGHGDVLFAIRGNIAFITLNRAKALNAINNNIAIALFEALKYFAQDDSVAAIVIEGEGRAFCSGGDVVSAYHSGQAGQPAYEFFKLEYLFNIYLASYEKPYIAILDGIVMGGGAGMSAYGKYRLATQNTVFAMPEAAIGFLSDVGAAYFLQTTSLAMRLYLCLTGARIGWGDCLSIGFATHCVDTQQLPSIKAELAEALSFLTWQKGGNNTPIFEAIDKLFTKHSVAAPPVLTSLQRQLIEACFAVDSLSEILNKLQDFAKQGNEFAIHTISLLQPLSPLSLEVIFKHVNQAHNMSLADCMKQEYRITHHMLKSHDFYEGIRAMLIDKDKAPQWQYKAISEIPAKFVSSYFSPLQNELF